MRRACSFFSKIDFFQKFSDTDYLYRYLYIYISIYIYFKLSKTDYFLFQFSEAGEIILKKNNFSLKRYHFSLKKNIFSLETNSE